jgi:hypothetical protein
MDPGLRRDDATRHFFSTFHMTVTGAGTMSDSVLR